MKVRTFLQDKKLTNATKEIESVKAGIQGLAETRLRNNATIQYGYYTFLHSGNERRSDGGVEPLVSKKSSKV